MDIRILDIRKLNGGSKIKAICDFKLGDSEFYSWKVIQQEDQHPWVSCPQETWTDDSNKKHYKPLIKLSKELMKTVSKAILEAYNSE